MKKQKATKSLANDGQAAEASAAPTPETEFKPFPLDDYALQVGPDEVEIGGERMPLQAYLRSKEQDERDRASNTSRNRRLVSSFLRNYLDNQGIRDPLQVAARRLSQCIPNSDVQNLPKFFNARSNTDRYHNTHLMRAVVAALKGIQVTNNMFQLDLILCEIPQDSRLLEIEKERMYEFLAEMIKTAVGQEKLKTLTQTPITLEPRYGFKELYEALQELTNEVSELRKELQNAIPQTNEVSGKPESPRAARTKR